MNPEIQRVLAQEQTAATLGRALIEGYLSPSLGAISKTETDNLVFKCLVETGAVRTDRGIYDIARRLNVTPTKAKNLLFQWQLRMAGDDRELENEVIENLLEVRFSSNGKLLTFGIENPLLREKLRAMFIEKKLFPDGSFSDEIVKVPIDQFVEFLDHRLDDQTKTQLIGRLYPNNQRGLSFKGVAKSALQHWGRKVIGKAADDVVEQTLTKVTKLMRGVFKGEIAEVEPVEDDEEEVDENVEEDEDNEGGE